MTLSLYVHFPWCVRKCPYCDFNSHPLRGALQTADYLAALEADAREALAEVPHAGIATVFFGGGTPSLFRPARSRSCSTRWRPGWPPTRR